MPNSQTKANKKMTFSQNGRILHHNLQGSPRGSYGHWPQQHSHRRPTKSNSLNYKTCSEDGKQLRGEGHPQDLTTTHSSLQHDPCALGKSPNHAQRKNVLVDMEDYNNLKKNWSISKSL